MTEEEEDKEPIGLLGLLEDEGSLVLIPLPLGLLGLLTGVVHTPVL